MSKKVAMSTKPKTGQPPRFSADDWVAGGNVAVNKGGNGTSEPQPDKEPTARFTIDIPVSLHARIKSRCALKRVKMREEILSMLEDHFPEE